jgi:putative membrane protein
MQQTTEPAEPAGDRNTQLAVDRTVLAVERTYAAWVRTGLAGLASGIAAKKFLAGIVSDPLITLSGALLVLFGAFCFIAAIWRQTFHPRPTADMPRIKANLLMVVTGFLLLVSLVALFAVIAGGTGAD